MRPVWAEIDLNRIIDNVRFLKSELKKEVLFMAVVKADGYGHGAIPVADAAIKAGADRLGVALIEEGVELRQAGTDVPIHILSEISPSVAGIEDTVIHDLTPTVCQLGIVELLSKAATAIGKEIRVHVKVDTGMNRLGIPCDPDKVLGFLRRIANMPSIAIEGVFTHFATADDPETTFRNEQLERFQAVIRKLDGSEFNISLYHAANSAAVMDFSQSHLDMVRVGIALYGLHPSVKTPGIDRLKPALSFKARISSLKTVPPGQGISYGLTHITSKEKRIATVPLGYADGYNRLLSNKGRVLVDGVFAPVVGTICMDQFMIDVSQVSGVEPGTVAVLIGQDGDRKISAEEIAGLLNTINYEVVCSISKRVPRSYL